MPAGFTEATFASGIPSPTAMEFAPDGRLFVCQQNGALRVIKAGVLLATPFVSLPVDSVGERGLLGIAFDPNFAANQFLYLYYTVSTAPKHNRVSRFTASGDVAAGGSEVVLLDLDNLSAATNHNGGGLHFGPDGKLYIGVGENATDVNTQTLNNRLGKMLRMNSDGSIPGDNPFFSVASGANRVIWALGLRNPYTFAFQPGTGRLFINDVGQSAFEEINDGIAGSNYGWPNTEGPTNDPNFRGPIFSYAHGGTSTTGCAIVGGTFYNPSIVQFPANYVGLYFFSDLCNGWVRTFDPTTATASPFASGFGSTVDLKVGPDGALYVLAAGSGSVIRIAQAVGQNHPPQVGGVSPATGMGSVQTFVFSVSDADGQSDLSVVNVLVNGGLDGRQACYFAYVPSSDTLFLVNDAGSALLPGITLSQASQGLSNSQCTLNPGGSSAVNGPNGALTLSLNLTFTPAFAGNKLVYMAVRDNASNNTGWQPVGVWTVPGALPTGTISLTGLSPSRIQGNSQPITLTVVDTAGRDNIGVVNLLISDALDGRHACFLAYSRPLNVLYLVNDAGDALLPGLLLNGSGTIGNSQCTVAGAGSSVSGAGQMLQLTLSVSALPAFAGNRIIYAAARDINEGNNTGWQALGSWTVQ